MKDGHIYLLYAHPDKDKKPTWKDMKKFDAFSDDKTEHIKLRVGVIQK